VLPPGSERIVGYSSTTPFGPDGGRLAQQGGRRTSQTEKVEGRRSPHLNASGCLTVALAALQSKAG